MSEHSSPSQPAQASLRRVLVAFTDLVGACLLVLWGLFLGPLGLLRGTLSLGNVFWYVWVLSPEGLLRRLVSAAIDWRLGNLEAAVFQMEFICSRIERYNLRHPRYNHGHCVLEDFYTLLARAYLHGGHMDEAMMVVLRAKKSLGIDRLPGLARLDAKTAHLVRAGLAAGRLLDGGGLATLFVKSNSTTPAQSQPMPANPHSPHPGIVHDPKTRSTTAHRQGATANPLGFATKAKPKMGQIIQFPLSTRLPKDSQT